MRLAIVTAFGFMGYTACGVLIHPRLTIYDPGFTLVEVPESVTGIHSEMSDILRRTDPRVRHFAKWIMSVGDAVAVGDFDNDGRPDLFITTPLKLHAERRALYR